MARMAADAHHAGWAPVVRWGLTPFRQVGRPE
jgi:hypothetical protein